MASCYGPTFVSAVPLLVFKRAAYAGEGGGFRGRCGADWALVATGSLANVEPDRIMLKKIVLTGFPIRVRKRFAVVKHMFHEPQVRLTPSHDTNSDQSLTRFLSLTVCGAGRAVVQAR